MDYFCILPLLFFNPFLVLPPAYATPNPYKLPDSLVPLNYFLQIRPIFHESHNESFHGQNGTAPTFIKITVSCVSPTNTIVLHQKFLEINESSIQLKRVYSSASSSNENELNSTIDKEDDNDNVSLVTSGDGDTVVFYDEDKNFMSFNSTSTLIPGNIYEISMSFLAKIPKGGSIDGLYRVKYQPPFANPSVGPRVMAVTSFEPLGARQVFPCFDEPIYKATWDIVIGKMRDFTVLSNGPLISTTPDDDNPDWFWDRFGTTVKLPTYLVAFAILSDFDFAEAPSSLYRLPVRVYGPKEWVSSTPHAQLVANFSAQLLSFYEDHFGVPFDMPKLDSLWIAKKREATECHGLILYGEQILIAEQDGSAPDDLASIRFHLNLIAHEISHSWFGNMVGSSWTEVWLKEGISTLVSPWGLDAIKPEIGVGTDHLVFENINAALHYDGGEQSHELRKEAWRKEEIDLNMDTIGYDKGAALGRMMKGLVGDLGFLEGLRGYLSRFKGGVASQVDLFRELGKVGGRMIGDRDLGEVMGPWTEQKGYPLIRVKEGGGEGLVIVSQEAFEHWEGKGGREGEDEIVSWEIPVKYEFIKKGEVKEGWFWLNKGEMEREVDLTDGEGEGEGDDEWVFLGNSDSSGYYRILYEDNLAKRIVAQLNRNHSVFGAAARARLLDDQLNLAFQRYIPIQDALEFTRYLGKERDSTVWNCVLQPLLQVIMLFRPTIIGLQTEEDFIHLRDTLHLKLIEEFEDAFKNSSSNNYGGDNNDDDDTFLSNPVNFSKFITILYTEIFKSASNGVDNESFKSFRNYLLPRINSTLVDITSGSHAPGSKNFSLTAEGLLESALVDWSCALNSEWCFQYSFNLKEKWTLGDSNATSLKNPIPSDIQAKMYCHIVDWFGVPGFEWIYSQFEASNGDVTQQTLFSIALGCSPPDGLSFHKLLSILMANETNTSLSKMDTQFVSTIYEKMMQHSEFGTIFMSLLLSFLEPSQYQAYLHLGDVNEAKGFFGYLQNYLWTGFHLQLVEHLISANAEYYEESLNGTIDAIMDNAFWMETFRENITLWMSNATDAF